jgi:hypothetical protein
MFGAVNLSIAEIVLVGEVRLQGQMIATRGTLETLFVKDDLVDRSDLLHRIDAIVAPGAFIGRRWHEQLP